MPSTKPHFQKTHKEFAKETKIFLNSCSAVNIPPTSRQASKWRMKKGLAYKTANNLV